MADKIEKLTPEQEEMVPVWRKKYLDIGWSTQKADRERAERGMSALYARAGKKVPQFIWFDSPKGAFDCIRESTNEEPSFSGVNGQIDSYWLAYYAFGEYVKPDMYKKEDSDHLKEWADVIESCGPCFPYTNYCLMTERPVRACYDDNEKLHSDDGPALEYRDGFKVWCIHDINVSEDLGERAVMRPWELTLEEIEGVENMDLRTILQDRWCYEKKDSSGAHVGAGGGRYLKETGAEQVHEDVVHASTEGDAEISILRTLLRDKIGRQFLCCCDSSTDRVYYIRVDPAVKTCEEAHMSINGGIPDDKISGLS